MWINKEQKFPWCQFRIDPKAISGEEREVAK